MARHVGLLCILVNLWGALVALVGVSMLLLAGGAFALSANPGDQAVALAAGVSAAVFASVGIIALVWGFAHVGTAALLRRHRPAGRLLMLGLGITDLLVFPFGTGLGAYALWVLLSHDGRQLFEAPGETPPESTLR